MLLLLYTRPKLPILEWQALSKLPGSGHGCQTMHDNAGVNICLLVLAPEPQLHILKHTA